ncbi:MAG TPA: polysaccharide deacetylase family protein [Gemmatimonadaceae bacterium]|nr:polysaccharide deacetylase family protein [Gemmatimonadaceae bacterium]
MPLPLILCYHKVERRLELGVTRISPRRFAKQIERLAHRGYRTIALEDVVACARGQRVASASELAITFDDAYRGLRDHAFPVLAAHGFTAACFVITEYAGRLNRWDVAYGGRRFAHLAWRDVERWSGKGITFGSHTATHPRLTWLSERDAAYELTQSRAAMQAALGSAPVAISYPFGAARARELRLAREAGYEVGFTLDAYGPADPLAIPRLPVYMWSPPTPGVGLLAPIERLGARGANRCAVGTSLWRQLGRT